MPKPSPSQIPLQDPNLSDDSDHLAAKQKKTYQHMEECHTVHGFLKSGINSPVEVGSLSQYLQGFFYIQGGAGFLPSTVLPNGRNLMVPTRWVPFADRYSNGVKWGHRYKWPK